MASDDDPAAARGADGGSTGQLHRFTQNQGAAGKANEPGWKPFGPVDRRDQQQRATSSAPEDGLAVRLTDGEGFTT